MVIVYSETLFSGKDICENTSRSSTIMVAREIAVFLLLAAFGTADPVLGNDDVKVVCSPPVVKTPLQKYELELSWPATGKSGYERLSERLGSLYFGYQDPSQPFQLAGQAVAPGVLCQLLNDTAHPLLAQVLSPLFCEDCHDGCRPVCVFRPPEESDEKNDGVFKDFKFSDEKSSEPLLDTCVVNSPSPCVYIEGDVPAKLEHVWRGVSGREEGDRTILNPDRSVHVIDLVSGGYGG